MTTQPDNIIEALADACVDMILNTFDAAGSPWDSTLAVDAALTLAASRLLENTSAMCEVPHISIDEIADGR